MIVKCPCGRKLKARPEQMGKKARCPNCKRILVIPTPQPAASGVSAKIPELDKIQACLGADAHRQMGTNAMIATVAHRPGVANEPTPPDNQIIRRCNLEERGDEIVIQTPPNTDEHEEGHGNSDDSPPQNTNDQSLQMGNLWSRSMIELGNRLCPKCKKAIPSEFKKCSHCGEYFDGVPQKNHCPNCGHDVPLLRLPRSAAEFSSLLLNGVTCQVCGYEFKRRTKFVRWFSLSCLVFTILWAAWFSIKSYGMLESVF